MSSLVIGVVATLLAMLSLYSSHPGPLTAALTVTSVPSSQTVANTAEMIPAPVVISQFNVQCCTALVSWTGFAGALIWRGHIRSVWSKSHFSYDTFRLIVTMRGAQTRLKLMHSMNGPKNKLQLATALGIDWKAVDKHVQVLEKNGLIQPTTSSGTTTFYEVTDKGRRLLEVLEELDGTS